MSETEHRVKEHMKRQKGQRGKVSAMIAKLMRERAEGTGPHSGKGGPLVTDPKQIQAMAYSKVRRGEG